MPVKNWTFFSFVVLGFTLMPPASDGSEWSTAHLKAALGRQHLLSQIDAAIELGRRQDTDAVDSLIRTLSSEDALLRRASAWALGRIKSPDALTALIKSLDDTDPFVAETSAIALGAIGDAGAIDGLLAAAGRNVVIGRYQKMPRMRNRLSSPLDDSYPPVVGQATIHAIRSIAKTDRRAIVALARALNHDQYVVRYVAARGLHDAQSRTVATRFNRALARRDQAVIAGACRYFLALRSDAVNLALVDAVEATSDPACASAMLRSGDSVIAPWAAGWLRGRGFKNLAGPGSSR